MASRIAEIVDATAAIAASVSGIVAVFGSGRGNIDDPLRSGKKIRAAQGGPTEPYEHWSEVGSLIGSEWATQDGGQIVTWAVAMRVWLDRTELDVMRQNAQPLFPAYLSAFQADPTLGGLCMLSRIIRMDIGDDPPRAAGQEARWGLIARWGHLDINLEVQEVVDP